MKISLFSIVYNIIETLPEKMFELNIQNMIDYVDEIIIIEGATTEIKTDTNGRSNDGTIELLKKLGKKYDKVKIVIGDGHWKDKIEMCNAASKIATGDYIWQLDSDEFYIQDDIKTIKKILIEKKPDAIYFYANHFIGGFNYYLDESAKRWGNNIPWCRIFRHIPNNSRWIEHRPPTYLTDGKVMNKGYVINRDEMLSYDIKMYHYSYVQKSQIDFKSKYYRNKVYLDFWDKFKTNKETTIFGEKIKVFYDDHPDVIKNNYIRL